MLRSIGKHPGNPWSQSRRKNGRLWWEGFAERKVLSLEWKSKGVMDDESGESMELVEEVPLEELGEAELERLVRGWRRGAGSWFQRREEAEVMPPSVHPHIAKCTTLVLLTFSLQIKNEILASSALEIWPKPHNVEPVTWPCRRPLVE